MRIGSWEWIDPNNLHHHPVKYPKAYSYAKSMEKGDQFPPVKVYIDKEGKLLVVDGAHRTAAAKMIEETVLIEVVGKASEEEDYSLNFKYRPKAKDFWYKKGKKY